MGIAEGAPIEALHARGFRVSGSRVWGVGFSDENCGGGRCPLLISSGEYVDSGPCLGKAWADTDNPVL